MPLKLSELTADNKVEVVQDQPKTLKLSELTPANKIEYDTGSSKITSAMAGFSQGSTMGFADEAVAGIKGLADYIEGKTGARGDISLSDAYRTHRDAIRRGNQKLQDDNPGTYKTAEIASAVVPAVLSAGAAAPVTAGKVIAGGAIAGQGYSNADLGTAQNAFDTGLGGAVALGTYGAFKLGGKALSEVSEKVAPVFAKAKEKLAKNLSDFAEERAAKAAIGGGNLKAFKDLAARKGGIKKFGRAILDENTTEDVLKDGQVVKQVTSKIMKAGSKPEAIAERAGAKLKEVGKVFDEVYDAIDDSIENAVDARTIAAKMRQYAADALDMPNTRAHFERVIKQAEEIEGMGNISMRAAQKLRNSYKYKPRHDSGADVLPSDVQNKLKGLIGDEMDETIKLVDSLTPNSTGLYPVFKRAKELYGTMKTTRDAGDKAAVRELSNRFASPTDHLAAAATFAADAASGGAPLASGAKALTFGAVNKAIRGRGNSASAVTADYVSKLLQKRPESLGTYGPMLIGAAKQGQTALGNLHQILWRNDPKYRSLLSIENPKSDSKMSAKPNLNNAMRRRLEK